MSDIQHTNDDLHPTTHGHVLAAAEWLDAHFEASRPEYEAMLHSVGLQPGWRVLDAGCGGGSFIPLIAQAVGTSGHVTALDLAPENISALEARLDGWGLPCPVAGAVGSLLALPFPDDHFDAVWCANVIQYLTDEELTTSLREFRRVVRPGGLVAVKEVDITIWNIAPGDPSLMWRLIDSVREQDVQMHGMLRTPHLRGWLERAGLDDVWQRRTLIERWAPLRPVEQSVAGELLAWASGLAATVTLPDDDQRRWQVLRDPDHPNNPIHRPDYHEYGANVVAVGQVPPSSDA